MINRTQAEIITDQTIAQWLRKWKQPNIAQLLAQLNRQIRQGAQGLPVTPAITAQIGAPVKEAMPTEQIEQDLHALYAELGKQEQSLMTGFSATYQALEQISRRAAELEDAVNRSREGYGLGDGFHTRALIDPTTTAMHHLQEQAVTLPYLTVKPVDLSYAQVMSQVLTEQPSTFAELTDLSGLLNGYTNQPWIRMVDCAFGPVTINITLTLPAKTLLNEIEISHINPAVCRVSLQTMVDTDVQDWGTQVGTRTNIFRNATQSVKQIRLGLTRVDPDPISNGRTWTFMIESIVARLATYAASATFVGKAMAVPMGVAQWRLSVVATEPPGTHIRYALSDGTSSHTIRPNESITLHNQNIALMTLGVPASDSILQHEIQGMRMNGRRFYRLGVAPATSIVDSKLYVGVDTWRIRQVQKSLIEPPIEQDWENTWDSTYWQMPAESLATVFDTPPAVTEDTLLQYQMAIYCPSELSGVRGLATGCTTPIAIYLGTDPVPRYRGTLGVTKQTMVLNFRKGWNLLRVYVYRTVEDNNAADYLDLGFDLRAISSKRYSEAKSLSHVSPGELRHNTRILDSSKFAILEKNGATWVILNHLVPGLQYAFEYQTVTQTITELSLTAELIRDLAHSDQTPILYRYDLLVDRG